MIKITKKLKETFSCFNGRNDFDNIIKIKSLIIRSGWYRSTGTDEKGQMSRLRIEGMQLERDLDSLPEGTIFHFNGNGTITVGW